MGIEVSDHFSDRRNVFFGELLIDIGYPKKNTFFFHTKFTTLNNYVSLHNRFGFVVE